ncbi:peroxisomal 2 4-dienoyl-CoA reductase sps19 [Knufia peltigerae]|uniref:2,4-dienoyl-CoA reductase [(3E)-enoyl-CoA-producing] n=1 Tax=Knufia peltigerae TaxID=1002370 RepID=A0AA39CZI1_9EURO|nr:peroxisomal 2 4-dienoyl-CoA reductase sps19 [Knufia peltigerae]
MPRGASGVVSQVWRDGIFDGKVVFCTGGNGSICSAQVRALVVLGADACIVGRNVQKTDLVAKDIALVRRGSKVLGIGGVDVRSLADLESAAKRCAVELGGIDFLIEAFLSAGAAGNFLAPLHSLSANAFKTVQEIDVQGSFNVTKACMPFLLESVVKHSRASSSSPSGRIIYVSATNHYTGVPLQSHVNAAKAGVDAFSASVAIEYGPLGITSNVIAPGPIADTEGFDRLIKRWPPGEAPWKRLPLGRWGSVKDIADATVFLFSDAANYVTGEVLVVDGAAWRVGYGPGHDFPYPDSVLAGSDVSSDMLGQPSKHSGPVSSKL